MCQRIGLPPISTIGLGRTTVSSLMREPRPPASMTAFMSVSFSGGYLNIGQAKPKLAGHVLRAGSRVACIRTPTKALLVLPVDFLDRLVPLVHRQPSSS